MVAATFLSFARRISAVILAHFKAGLENISTIHRLFSMRLAAVRLSGWLYLAAIQPQ
tara:strand:- start:51 stop:221 length:171 start_codon:yes stop_codon:yes gene_type:complete